MSMQVSDSTTAICPRNHENPGGSDWCSECGLPIVDYETELDFLVKALVEQEQHVKFVREKIFLGIGDQGCKFIQDFYLSWGRGLRSTEFLVIESSADSQHPDDADEARLRTVTQYKSPSISFHRLPESPSKHVGYQGLGERLAASDQELDDLLRRSGIRASTTRQTVFLLAALGGGTGSGAGPYALQRARALNPNCRNLVVGVMPTANEPDSAHFNALCSLSRFIKFGDSPSADMILLVNHDRLMEVRGVGSMGEELAGESLLSHMLAAFMGNIADRSSSQTDLGYLAKMSRSMALHTFVPCVAAGCSLEIFGGMTNIAENALSCRLADVDTDSVALSYMLVQVPERLCQTIPEEKLRADLNKWNKGRFPRLKGSVIQLSHSSKRSDRIDLCILLGGTKLAVTAKRAKEGFDRFRTIVESDAWEKEFAVTSESVGEMREVVESHDARLDEMAN